MATVRMVHTYFDPDHEWTEYFYDGELHVKNGTVEVPEDHPEWAHRLWILGYRTDRYGQPITDLETYFEEEKARDATGDAPDASSDVGRQPEREDGIRESTAESSGSLPGRRVGSLSRDRARARA